MSGKFTKANQLFETNISSTTVEFGDPGEALNPSPPNFVNIVFTFDYLT